MNSTTRHLLATLIYRFDAAIANITPSFPNSSIGQGVRTPFEILNHLTGLMSYAIYILTDERPIFQISTHWADEERAFKSMAAELDKLLADKDFPQNKIFRIVQGPLADALTHVGQLAMLSRLDGSPVEKQNYSKAKIGADL